MIDFAHLDRYRENNRIEAKKAMGGLPQSLWETYSSFANTIGGYLLLGVEELPGKVLSVSGLPDAEETVHSFWELVNDKRIASVNILRPEQVQIVKIEGLEIVVIEVPRASRYQRPVYVGGDPYTGSYRRGGEGDYHCTREEVDRMLMEREEDSRDALPVKKLFLDALCRNSVEGYRDLVERLRPLEQWHALSAREFLRKAGAAGRLTDTKAWHPTRAGLLLLGQESKIKQEFPRYSLEYEEEGGVRLFSGSGDWSGNLFDFYWEVCRRLWEKLKGRFPQEAAAAMKSALEEGLANSLIHADYDGTSGLAIRWTDREVIITNPGGLRMSLKEALEEKKTDSRNRTLSRMFALMGVGKGTGRGLGRVHGILQRQHLELPEITEQFNPERTVFRLRLDRREKAAEYQIIQYLTGHIWAGAKELKERLHLEEDVVKAALDALEREKLLTRGIDGLYFLTE